MAGYKYYTILTDIGKQKLVEAISNETPIDFTEIAVGDANGVSYNPTGEETELKHEVFKKAIDSVSIDSIDKNIMIFEMVVPASSGGYYMREAGLFASDGTLIAVARIAEQYKPLLEEGAGSSITISMRIAISSDAQVYINIPESINYATQNFVQEEFKKHKADENPHTQYVILEAYNEKVDELEQALAGKADSNHRHDDLYSDINHTHSNYAASNHNHDSTYLKKTDASSTYATKTEMNKGLAGKAASNHNHSNYSASNHNHDSVYSKLNHTHAEINTTQLKSQDIFTTLGITQSLTTAEFVTKISQKFGNFYGVILSNWIHSTGNIHITDAPADIIYLTITILDNNGIFLEAREPFANNSLWIGSVSGGKFGGWKQVLNNSGQAKTLEITGTEAGNTWHYCGNIGLTAHYANPDDTIDSNGQNKLSEPVLMLSLGSPYNDRKVQLAIGTDTNSLYVRTARTESIGTGYYLYGVWRKI